MLSSELDRHGPSLMLLYLAAAAQLRRAFWDAQKLAPLRATLPIMQMPPQMCSESVFC